MKQGKQICETLKGIRADIARANDIDYHPAECHHEGDCAGTCPACESEVRWLERQLRLRQQLGKVVTIAGLSIGAAALATSCNMASRGGQWQGDVPNANGIDTNEVMLDGEVVCPEPDSVDSSAVEKPDTSAVKKPDTMPSKLRNSVIWPPKPTL